MTRAGSGLIDRLSDKRALRRWTAIARASNELSIEELRRARSRARALHGQLSAVLVAAEARLTLPFSGRGAIREAADADWAWRPDLWRGPIFPPGLAHAASGDLLGYAVKVLHYCPKA